MAYTFLDNSLNTIGVLTNKGGQTNDYWGDSITHEIATSQDVLTSVSLSVDKPSVNIDTSGNQKTWNHVIQGLSFNIDGIGRKVNENDYLIYQEGTNGKYYLMAITQVDESAVQSGFHYKTVQGLNAAAYDLSRKTLRAKSFAQIPDNTQEKGTAQNILKYIFEDINWDVRTIGSFGAVDYDIAEGTTAQAVLLDIIGMFEAEVDAYVQLNNWGKGANVFNKNGSIKRIFDFSTSLGKYRGETIRYDKNMVSITKTGARDSMYTKLYVNGNNITIADANKGADFIVDDVANRKYNKLGAVSTPVTYLEGIISNSAIESPTALLAWGKKQLKILNHPRYNYQISATNDDKVQLGDTVIIQDTHASDPIYLKSKVISKTVSLADPANNSFIVGEFSPIVIGADNGLEDTNQIMQLVNQANQTAINAQNKANENAKKIVDTRTNLEKTIDQKLQEGKDYSNSLNKKQKEAYDKFEAEINAGMDSAAAERAEISKKADDMLVSANSHADDMYNNAVTVAKDEASKALSDANKALDEAKTDLTTNLNKEISDRNKAVSAVNSQAQDYAIQAKSDAIEAANTADGKVRKDFKETTDALSSTITQNKQDSDGKISTAQSTATQALDGLSTKVSQTDYDKKTGDLSTKVNTVTQTATETKDELANVSKTVDSQSAKINTISNTVDGTKQTISDIKTEQGKQSGSIATLQSRADGFDATVTKVNNLSVGGRNLLLDTGRSFTGVGDNSTNGNFNAQGGQYYLAGGKKVSDLYNQYGSSEYLTLSFDWLASDSTISGKINPVWNNTPWGGLATTDGIQPSSTNKTGHYEITVPLKANGYSTGTATGIIFRQDNLQGNITINNVKLEAGNVATDWSPAPEDLSSATAKAQLTADKANLDLSKYKTDADGRISKAQSDITATSKEVKTKVSQSDFDTKTGDLTTKYGQVKATADAVTTDVSKYKTANDKKVSANTASISTMSDQITSKVSKTDFDKKTGELNGKFTQQKQTVDSISQTVTELQAKANAQGQVNQLMNTEFNPDLEGWSVDSTDGKHDPYRSYLDKNVKATTVGFYTLNADTSKGSYFARFYQSVPLGTAGNGYISLSWQSYLAEMADNMYGHIWIKFHDKNGNAVYNSTGANPMGNWISNGQVTWKRQKMEKIEIPQTATEVTISFEAREGIRAYLVRPMLVFDDHTGDYAQGNYNNNSRVTALELDVNGIHGTVNDPKKGLSATWNLANQGQTLAVQAQKDAKTADGKAVAAQKDATTAVTTAKGTQTTVTSVQKDVKDVQSKQTQTANQVTIEIKDRKNGDTNTLTQAKNFTSSEINKSETGMKTAIQQSAEGVVAQVSHVNQLFNTQFEDLTGWNITQHGGTTKDTFYRSILDDKGRTAVGVNIPDNAGTDANKHYAQFEQDIRMPGWKNNVKLSLSWRIQVRHMLNYAWLWVTFLNADKSVMKRSNGSTANAGYNYGATGNNADGKWHDGKFENITVPDGCVWIRVSFQAREGTNLYMTSPMATFTDKAQPYMPGGYHKTDTVLELFDDRFALGVKNNTGNIISGINGDSTGLSIVGKKITISGDTTFQGSNFMNGAIIKNASIASAKIQNLDVDKLTGKTTEFVKSSWKSAYGYVDIEFGQMSVMGNNGITRFGDGYIHISAMNIAKNPPVLEDIGSFGSNKNTTHTNVDYLAINLNLWNTGNGYGEYGGDGIAFNVSQLNGTYQSVLSWESQLSAGYLGWLRGWQFRDYATFQNNLFGPNREQIGIGNINAVPALSIGDPLTGIAGNNGNLYFYTKNGYISLDDLINNKTGRASFRRTGFWK